MATRFVNIENKLPASTALYYPAIAGGLSVTIGHFLKNMLYHTIGLFGNKGAREKASFTLQYPEVMRPLPRRLRTRHRIKVHEDGRPKCTACMLCETACPDFCIYITPSEHDDSPEEKAPLEFQIDLDRCCFCGFCVEACPKDAIHMDTQIMETSSDRRENMVLRLQDLVDPGPVVVSGPEFAGKDMHKVLPHLGMRKLDHIKPRRIDLSYRERQATEQGS